MKTLPEKVAALRAEAARVRFDRSPFALTTVALSPDTLDSLLDDLEAVTEQLRPAAYLHEPCGTVATAEWVEQTNGGCTSCEWVTFEGWTALIRADRDLADVVTPPGRTSTPALSGTSLGVDDRGCF